MEILELATSAGINILLAMTFLLLYSVFRKQPSNAGVYFTRHLLRERRSRAENGNEDEEKEKFSFENLVPSAGWAKRALEATEDDILHSSGLDAVVFLRIFSFG